MRDGLLGSPTAPLEQAYLTYKIGWLAGRKLGIPAPHQPRINPRGQISTSCITYRSSIYIDFLPIRKVFSLL